MKSHEGYDDFDLKDNICVMKVDDITFSSGYVQVAYLRVILFCKNGAQIMTVLNA